MSAHEGKKQNTETDLPLLIDGRMQQRDSGCYKTGSEEKRGKHGEETFSTVGLRIKNKPNTYVNGGAMLLSHNSTHIY